MKKFIPQIINVPKIYEVRHLEEQTQLREEQSSVLKNNNQPTQVKQITEKVFFASCPDEGGSGSTESQEAAKIRIEIEYDDDDYTRSPDPSKICTIL